MYIHLSVSICHWDHQAEIPRGCAVYFYHVLDSSFALLCCQLLPFPPLFERCSNWPVSSFSLAWHEITPCIYGGWGYNVRMKIFPHLHRQNASDSRGNEKVQLFFEVNIKLLCGRHKILQHAFDVTRLVMKCSTSLMCLRTLLHEGHSGHMVFSNCQETFADFAWEVSV